MLSFRRSKRLVILSLAIIATAISAITIIKNNETLETFAANTYEAYAWGEWVYYDPVNHSSCNESNYWTPFSQNTTCYRWFLIEEDSSSQSTLKLILDHNLTTSTWDNLQNTLSSSTNDWTGINNIAIMTESQARIAMQIQNQDPPTLSSDGAGSYTSSSISPTGSTGVSLKLYRLATSSLYFNNGARYTTGGFWLNDYTTDPNGEKWGYEITEYGNNKLAKANGARGVRPIIVLPKNATGLTHESSPKNISNNASTYYESGQISYNSNTFSQLQGFTFAGNNLIFFANNDNSSSSGLVSNINSSGGVAGRKFLEGAGHGNDMTYNTKTGQVLLTGPNSYGEIWALDKNTLEPDQGATINSNQIGFKSSVIGYDEFHNYLVLSRGLTAYIIDSNYNTLYTIDMPHDATPAGIEYHNGYIYQASWESVACRNHNIGVYKLGYQMYCSSLPGTTDVKGGGSSIINVYNAKLNSDGTPSAGFGRRVKKLIIPYATKFGELETVSFNDDKMYLGFSSRYQDYYGSNSNLFRFYSFASSSFANALGVSVSYIDSADSTTVVISSDDGLESLSGYTLSNDNRQLSKTVQSNTISVSPTVCDHYNNCTTLNIQHTNSSYKSAQVVTFASSSVDKIYGDANFINAAITDGDGVITYTSDNVSVAEVNSSTGEVSIKGAGMATITATAASTASYYGGSASYILTVSKATSLKPDELNNAFSGAIGEKLSTIAFSTPGLVWADNNSIILSGENEYQVYYTQDNDPSNYTTGTFTVRVNGISSPKPTQIVTFANSSIDKTYGDSNFINMATTNGDGTILYTSNNTSVASINSYTGEVTIKGAGVATITAVASSTDNYASGTASYNLSIAKAASTKPNELNSVFNGTVGEKLSVITFSTPGLTWVNGDATILLGENEYQVYYTKDNDTSNYTTETFTATVNGVKHQYEVIEGDEQIYTVGESESLSFRIDADFSLFSGKGVVYIDGASVDDNNYSAVSGSTIIDFEQSYTDSLSAGKHDLLVTFGENGIATAEFTIVNPASDSDNPSDGNDDDSSDDEVVVPNTSSTSTPDTGKNTKSNDNMSAALTILLPALLAAGAYIIIRRKRVKHIKFDS